MTKRILEIEARYLIYAPIEIARNSRHSRNYKKMLNTMIANEWTDQQTVD